MNAEPIVSDRERRRMAAVRRYDILDTPPDGAFDRITALAARRCGVPISIISIVDEDRIWFKSHHGIDVPEIGRDPGLCASAILSDEPYLLTDASVDPRSLANPLVAGDFGLRFYAGVPLTTSDGHNLGTLCVIDKEARPIDNDQIEDLKDLASVVMDQLELQLSARTAISRSELLVKEIDHRVMNSLQFVSSLLNMQARSPGMEDTASHLQIAANRVAAVAQVHRHFSAGDSDTTSCIDFLKRLGEGLEAVLNRPVCVNGAEGDVPNKWIQQIGLIFNELVTNAAKHGEGQIDVRYGIENERHFLTVSDEGCNLPEDFDPAALNTSLGMRIVRALVDQLDGKFTAERQTDGSSVFKVSFPQRSQ